MAKKASSGGNASRKSSAPSVSRTQKTSILKSAFSPSAYQLSLFASVIQAFDSEHLRIHDFTSGRLQCDHGLGAGTRINSLDWGYYGPDFRGQDEQKPKKKRKRDQNAHEFVTANAKNAVVALATSSSDVQMFSPAGGRVVGTLSGVHERDVHDFKFVSGDCLWGWSIGGDGKMAQWDLKSNKAVRTISVPDANVNLLGPAGHEQPQILCASSTPYALDFESTLDFEHAEPSAIASFDSSRQPIHTIFRSGKDNSHGTESFLTVDSDRYINIFDVAQKRLLRTLIANSGVRNLSFLDHKGHALRSFSDQQLVAVTDDGLVEIFSRPFVNTSDPDESVKVKRKNMTRKANATVKLTRPDSTGSVIPVFNASFQGPDLILAWAEGGVELSFERIRWRDENSPELILSGNKELVTTKKLSTLSSGTTQDGKAPRSSHVDESHAVFVNGSAAAGGSREAAIMLSGDEGDEADDIDVMDDESISEGEGTSGEEDDEEIGASAAPPLLVNGVGASRSGDSDVEIDNVPPSTAPESSEEGADDPEPSFGDLLAARSANPISIAKALPSVESSVLVPTESNKPVAIPSGISLSTVLTQALRTNDNNLLESCFHNTDTQIIRSTIQRIDSSVAGILIQKLAERLSSRPGRYGHLLVWVQWLCVAHGGAIGGQPDVLSKIKTLYRVLNQRSKALDSLLLLKGKLDMLDAQLGLRKQFLTDSGRVGTPEQGPVIYIEGEEDSDSSDEDVALGDSGRTTPPNSKSKATKTLHERISDIEVESEDDEDMAMTNGVDAESEQSSFDSENDEDGHIQQREGGLVDDEAEESDEDSHPSDREDDVSEEDGVSDDDEEDSEMNDFIDDGPVEEADSASEISIDETPEKPPAKKHRQH